MSANEHAEREARRAQLRLEAAAPDLLAACERVADAERILLGILDRKLPGWREGYLFDEMFAQVRAAIARARGEEK